MTESSGSQDVITRQSYVISLQEIALSDEYFISRKLYPNVDFYSGAQRRRSLLAELLTPPERRSSLYFTAAHFDHRPVHVAGIVLRAIGIPTNMFTVLFAVARTAGWLAQWNEAFSDAHQRISRPRQVGSAARLGRWDQLPY